MAMILALMLTAAQPAPAASQPPDWRPLGTSQGQYSLSWDAASVVRGPDTVTVRFRAEAVQSPERSPHTVSRLEIRCAAAMMRVVETFSYAADGSILRSDAVPPPFEAIPAGSFAEIIHRAIC